MHPALVAATGAVALALLVIAANEGGAGRLMFGVAAAVAAAECARGALLRPTLETTPDGVRVAHGLWRRELLTWDDIDSAAMQRRSRRGATVTVAEVLAAIEAARAIPRPGPQP
jgi:hypothetical protein